VVGGSAAGLLTAGLVARAGRRVRILEASENLPEARTLIVTSRMRDLLGPASEASIVNEIRRFELFTDGRSAEVSLARPDLIIERSRLIRGLAEQAQHAGAHLQLGCRFLKLEANGDGLALMVEQTGAGQQEIHASTVVGADGAASRVAKAAGWPEQDTVPLLQAIVMLPRDYPPGTVRVWFVPDDTPYFYWLIPEGPNRGALGLIAEEGHEARSCLNRFLEKRHFTPLSFQGARVPVYRRWVPVSKQLGHGQVYLVGDAAAQVKVTTVGGIVTGFRGAIGVAEAILNGGRSRELRKLRRELGLHLLIRKALHRFQQGDYSRLVDLMNMATRRTLSVHTRDEAAKVLWNIALHQPRLVLHGLRGLLTKGSPSPSRNQTAGQNKSNE
jgi:flavin-dependent dehydrogenase